MKGEEGVCLGEVINDFAQSVKELENRIESVGDSLNFSPSICNGNIDITCQTNPSLVSFTSTLFPSSDCLHNETEVEILQADEVQQMEKKKKKKRIDKTEEKKNKAQKENVEANKQNEEQQIKVETKKRIRKRKTTKKLKNTENNKIEERQKRECPICFIENEENITLTLCYHSYCLPCMEHYLYDYIMTANVEYIPCPDPSCPLPLSSLDIKSIVSLTMYKKYEYFVQLAEWKKDPNSRWCPWCDHVSSIVYKGEKKIQCVSCLGYFCFSCQVRWHDDLTCDQFSQTTSLDKKTMKWRKKHKIKECPYCGIASSKIGGCPEVVCIGCHRIWYWYHDDPDWCQDGLYKRNETAVEKVAFYYPRLLKMTIGSRELRENKEDRNFTLSFLGLIGMAGIPATLVCGLPALSVRTHRNVKRKLSKLKTDDGDEE